MECHKIWKVFEKVFDSQLLFLNSKCPTKSKRYLFKLKHILNQKFIYLWNILTRWPKLQKTTKFSGVRLFA